MVYKREVILIVLAAAAGMRTVLTIDMRIAREMILIRFSLSTVVNRIQRMIQFNAIN